MNIANKSLLTTGANRGIGRALVEEALRRGAKQVYAAARSLLQHADRRDAAIDVTDTHRSRSRPVQSKTSTCSSTMPGAATTTMTRSTAMRSGTSR